MEYQLTDVEGNPVRSNHEDKKMLPDAVIKYPDNRHVIIDSKLKELGLKTKKSLPEEFLSGANEQISSTD